MSDPAFSSHATTPSVGAKADHSPALDPALGFSVRFWGVRGNIPTPGPETVRYGGNTACVEVNVGGQHLVLDGGTGLRALGKQLTQRAAPVDVHLFFTHAHWDRIQGFPFFQPAFDPTTRLNIYGAAAPNGASIKQCLMDQMLRPNFFKPLQTMAATMAFHTIQPGSRITLDQVVVEALSLNRHTSALGYRVDWQGHALVYASDTDPTGDRPDPNLIFLATGADVLIFDGTYLDLAYADPSSRYLSPWERGVEVARASGVKYLVLFHHNPCHDDAYLDQLEAQVQAAIPTACLAREGMALDVTVGGIPNVGSD